MYKPFRIGTISSNLQNKAHDSKQYRVYSPYGKATTLCGGGGGVGAKTGLYLCPTENKEQRIYTCRDGLMEGYVVPFPDGDYIIRKMTVEECKRLQTVPEWYDMSIVSNTQALKMLGNGWTCSVITYLIQQAMKDECA